MKEHFEQGYAEVAKTDGIGCNILEARLLACAKELKLLFDALTTVQQRCTEILLEKRELALALRLLNDIKALECSVSSPACKTCVRCRARALALP